MAALTWSNWGRNQTCRPRAIEAPKSELEVSELVLAARRAGERVKVVGAGHSFTDIACTDGRLVHLDFLDRIVAVDHEAQTVTVEGGMPLWRLNEALAARGLALANLGDIDRQAIAGAIATSTHGTGERFGGLATFVRGMELVVGDGSVVRCSPTEEPEIFHAARVHLGALGVVTKVTLQCVPAFRLFAHEYPMRFDEVVGQLDELAARSEHFEFYWFPHTDACAVKENNRTDREVTPITRYQQWRRDVLYPNVLFGATTTFCRVQPRAVPAVARYTASTLGRIRYVDRSDRVFCSPRLVRFVEMEYAIPRGELRTALEQLRALIDSGRHLVSFPIEVRVGAADDIPLSTASGRDTAWIAVHLRRGVPYESYFRDVEAIMAPLGGRPHWGKMHFLGADDLAARYPERDRFLEVRRRLDPEGRFANAYLDRVLGPVT